MHPCPFSWSRIITSCNHYWPFFVFFNCNLFVYFPFLCVTEIIAVHHSSHILIARNKMAAIIFNTHTFDEYYIKPCRWCIYRNDFLETKEKSIMKTLAISIIGAKRLGEEMVWGRNDYDTGAKRLGVKNRGETTRGEGRRPRRNVLEAKRPVTGFYKSITRSCLD